MRTSLTILAIFVLSACSDAPDADVQGATEVGVPDADTGKEERDTDAGVEEDSGPDLEQDTPDAVPDVPDGSNTDAGPDLVDADAGRDTDAGGADAGRDADPGDLPDEDADTEPDVPDGSDGDVAEDAEDADDADVADADADAQPDVGEDVPENRPPEAVASAPEQAFKRSPRVFLDGRDSFDPDEDPLTWQWRQVDGPEVTLRQAFLSRAVFAAPEVTGTVTFELEVSDGREVATATVSVQIVNAAPVAIAGDGGTLLRGALGQLNGTESHDDDGDALRFSWRQVAGEPTAIVGGDEALAQFAAPQARGMLGFELTVTDGELVATDTVEFEVVNTAPTADAGDDLEVPRGARVTLRGEVADPEGERLTHRWSQVAGQPVTLSDPSALDAEFDAPAEPGLLEFVLVANDGELDSFPDAVEVDVANRVPTVVAPEPQLVAKGVEVTLGAIGADADGDELTWAWRQIEGAQVDVEMAGTRSPRFVSPQVGGSLLFDVVVNDGYDSSVAAIVQVQVGNRAPTVDAGADRRVPKRESVELLATADDPDGDPISVLWTQVAGPPVNLDLNDILFPEFDSGRTSGTVVMQVVASDGEASSAPDTVSIEVFNRPPTSDTEPIVQAARARPLTLVATAEDPDEDPLTVSWTQVSGPEVEIVDADTLTPTLTTPDVTSELVLRLRVTDGEADAPDVDVRIEVRNGRPVADAGPNLRVLRRGEVTLDGTGSSDPEEDELTYSWTRRAGLPITIRDADTPTPTIEAPADETGSVTVQLSVSDGEFSHTDQMQLSVYTNRPVVAIAPEEVTVHKGEVLELEVTASDPDDDPLTYSWTGDVYISDRTVLSPTITIPRGETRDRSAHLTVSDGAETRSESVRFLVVNRAPTADAGPDYLGPLQASVDLDGSGSYDPDEDGLSYQWRQIEGVQVRLTDHWRPIATARFSSRVGRFAFELTVTDDDGASHSDVVVVEFVNRPPIADAGPDQEVSVDDDVILSAHGSSDPDNHSLDYTWEQISGPPVVFEQSPVLRFTAPEASTEFGFRLTVSDGLDEDTDEVVVAVVNAAPVVTAGVGGEWVIDGTLELRGTATDPEGLSMTYSWVQLGGPEAVISTPTALETEVAIQGGWGDLVLRLTATDSGGVHSSAEVVFTPPQAPSADRFEGFGRPFFAAAGTVHAMSLAGELLYVATDAGVEIFQRDDDGYTRLRLLEFGPDKAHGVLAQGDRLYVATAYAPFRRIGLSIFDRSNPTNPVLLGSVSQSESSRDTDAYTMIANETRVVVCGIDGDTCAIVDVTDPTAPVFGADFRGTDAVFAGDLVWVATSGRLRLYDVTDARWPTRLAEPFVGGGQTQIALRGDIMYMAGEDSDVRIFDMTDPDFPRARGDLNHRASMLQLVGDQLYTAAGDTGPRIYDVSSPLAPVLDAQWPSEGEPQAILVAPEGLLWAVEDRVELLGFERAFATPDVVVGATWATAQDAVHWVFSDSLRTTLVNVEDPRAPVVRGVVLPSRHVDVEGDLLVRTWGTNPPQMHVHDISDPDAPTMIATVDVSARIVAMHLDGDLLWVGFWNEVEVWSLAEPANPVRLLDGPVIEGLPGHYDIVADGDLLWIATSNDVRAFDVTDPTAPLMLSSAWTTGYGLAVGDDWVAAAGAGVALLDPLGDAEAPLSAYGSEVDHTDLVVAGTSVFAASDDRVLVYDGSDSSRVHPLGEWWLPDPVNGLRVHDSDVFVVSEGIHEFAEVEGVIPQGYEVVDALTPVEYAATGLAGTAEVACIVSAGSCTVDARDRDAGTATVTWTPSAYTTGHEIIIVAGDWTSWRVLRWDAVAVR